MSLLVAKRTLLKSRSGNISASIFSTAFAITLILGNPLINFTSFGSGYQTSLTGAHIRILPNPDIQVEAHFGQSVASSPGNIIIVGAPNQTAGQFIGAGAAYSFKTNLGTLENNFTSPNEQTEGHFGQSVAITPGGKKNHAFLSSIIIGAPNETVNGLVGAGRVYVFNTSMDTLTSTLLSPNGQLEGEFGWSVSGSGDLIVVGAPNETVNGLVGAGRAYVYSLTGALVSTFTSPNEQTDGHFGQSVGMSENNATNGTAVVVGAPGEDVNGLTEAGRAYLFNTETGRLMKTFVSPNVQLNGYFGWSVSLTEWEKSLRVVAVGAPGEMSQGFSSAGNAYGFKTSGLLLYNLTSPNPQTDGRFGWSVWLSEHTLGVGAPGENAGGFALAGNAYTFYDLNGSLVKTYSSPNAIANGSFGYSITIVQGPGPKYPGYIIGVGAPDENGSGELSSGNSYV